MEPQQNILLTCLPLPMPAPSPSRKPERSPFGSEMACRIDAQMIDSSCRLESRPASMSCRGRASGCVGSGGEIEDCQHRTILGDHVTRPTDKDRFGRTIDDVSTTGSGWGRPILTLAGS